MANTLSRSPEVGAVSLFGLPLLVVLETAQLSGLDNACGDTDKYAGGLAGSPEASSVISDICQIAVTLLLLTCSSLGW